MAAAFHSEMAAAVASDGVGGHHAAASLMPSAEGGAAHAGAQGTAHMAAAAQAHAPAANGEASHQQAPAALLHGTQGAAHAEAPATQVTAASIAMPSAHQLAAAAHGGAGGAQHNQVVGQVLAEALHGGGGGPDIDHVLASLPSHTGGGNPALEALASHNAAGVSTGDSHVLAAFTAAHPVFTMEAMAAHVDAVQTHA
jgi:hypothetical protein